MTEPTYNGGSGPLTKTFTYDSNRNMLTSNDGLVTYSYTYNSLGLVTRKEDSLGRYTEYDYNGVDLIEISDNLGTVATFDYDNTSLPHSITGFTDGASNEWTIGRNSFGQVTSITPPTGSPTGALTFTYEETTSSPEYGWLKSVTNGAGDTVVVDSYTTLGDPTSITTYPSVSVSRTVQYAYDATQRETVMTHDDGKTVQTDYTGANATEVTDEAGTLTQYSYCSGCGKLTGVSGPMSWALGWVLDGDRDVTEFTDALSQDTTYTYGTARELKKITYPDGQSQTYTYHNHGRLKKYLNRNAAATITYDASGNVTSDYLYNYTYDNANQLLTATGTASAPGSVVTYTYTNNRLVSSITYNFSGINLPTSQVVEYTYNPDQSVDTITWKNGTITVAQWEYGYDAAGRVTSIDNNFSETTNYTYDGEGKLLTQVNDNGTSREYTYNDQRGWPTHITYKQGTTTTMEYGLTYDGGANTVGNLTGVTETGGATVDYEYDDLYRLTEETRSSPSYARTYGYDLAGNPTTVNGSTIATFDAGNKLATIQSKAVTHDTDGNITGIATTSPVTFKTIEWTALNKISRVYQTTGGGYIDYRYLYDGKRYYSKAATGTTARIHYIYAGDTLIGEISATVPSVAYTWGPDGLISKRNLSTSTSHWYEFGPQGETRTLRNSSGTSTDTYYYNAYGEQTSSTGSTVNPYRYGGKYGYYSESYTGLVLATQRWYSPQLMRWVSRDPIGYEGGVNLYEYTLSNPVYYYDVSGYDPRSTKGGDDPGFENPEETIRELEKRLRDKDISQREKEQIRRRLKELRRRKSKKQQHHRVTVTVPTCQPTPDEGRIEPTYPEIDILFLRGLRWMPVPRIPAPPQLPIPIP